MPHDQVHWEDPLLQELRSELEAPFATELISWRVGSTNKKRQKQGEPNKGKPLAYIDARDVMERLDGVMGIGNWQSEYMDCGGGKLACRLGLYLDGQWVWKTDGAGSTDMEAEKGAFSDAFKRAAVRWGIGRYLYGLNVGYIDLNQYWKIPREAYAELNAAHDKVAAQVGMSSPSEKAAIRNLIQTIKNSVPADQVDEYRARNAGMLSQLRLAQRNAVENTLDLISEGRMAA